ncbi:MAG: outer membrane beta-barrel domain-containing protein [Bradymonadales bacterium]|nr:outer membrane beta-barrel domain-containing protein [Bradymonadales bacterium]
MLSTRSLIIGIACGLFVLSFAPMVQAQGRSLEEGPIVRRQLLFRSNRVEIAPSLGHTLNDSYRRTLYLNVAANYHLTNTFSLGVNVGWGALHYNTNLMDEIEASSPAVARTLDFAEPTLLGHFHLSYVPFYGKFNILEETTVNYDFHLIGGLSGALMSSDVADLDGFKFGPALGAGFRFFLGGDTAITIDLVDHLFSYSPVARPGVQAESSFSHQVMVSLGVSFFVTGELRVSR